MHATDEPTRRAPCEPLFDSTEALSKAAAKADAKADAML